MALVQQDSGDQRIQCHWGGLLLAHVQLLREVEADLLFRYRHLLVQVVFEVDRFKILDKDLTQLIFPESHCLRKSFVEILGLLSGWHHVICKVDLLKNTIVTDLHRHNHDVLGQSWHILISFYDPLDAQICLCSPVKFARPESLFILEDHG